jgi:hypothetical protein
MGRLNYLLLVGLALTTHELVGQTARYRPTETRHQGRDIVAIVIGSSQCGFSTWPKYMAVIDPLLRTLQEQARARGFGFTAVGMAVDDPADSGYAYLKRLAEFDEILTGRQWLNTGLVHFLWPDSTITPATPELLILARRFSNGVLGPRSVRTERLFFAQGVDSIMAFAKRGAPLP